MAIEKNLIRLTLCECSQGLKLAELKIEAANPLNQKDNLAQAILDRISQFKNGAKKIIGLSPVACLNLEHDYDHWRQRFFDMVTGQLMTVPGLALLAFDEAKTIAQEPGAGDQASNRVMPVMVEIGYRVKRRETGLSVQFQVQLAGSKSEQYQSPELPLEQAGAWLADDLNAKLLKDIPAPLELPAQQALLAKRAEHFVKLGDWPAAIRCREAFLIGQPSEVSQRLALIDDMVHLVDLPPNPLETRGPGAGMVMLRQNAFHARTLLDHYGYLVENKLIDRPKAIGLIDGISHPHWFMFEGNTSIARRLSADEETQSVLAALMSQRRQFAETTAAKILELEDSEDRQDPRLRDDVGRQQAAWYRSVAHVIAANISFHNGSMEGFRYLERIVEQVVPESFPLSGLLLGEIQQFRRSQYQLRMMRTTPTTEPSTITIGPEAAAMRSWLNHLLESDHAHLRLYAQVSLLLEKVAAQQNNPTPELLAELEQIIQTLVARPYSGVRLNNGTLVDGVLENLLLTKNTLLKVKPTIIPPVLKEVSEVNGGPLVVEKLDLPTHISGGVTRYTASKGDVDLVLRQGQTGLLFFGSIFEPLDKQSRLSAVAANSYITSTRSAAWDGQRVWVHESGGVFVYAADGKQLAKIAEQNLLPHAEGLELHVVNGNQVVAYGCAVRNERCWLALLDLEKSGPTVKVIHEARQPHRWLHHPKYPLLRIPATSRPSVMSCNGYVVTKSKTKDVCWLVEVMARCLST